MPELTTWASPYTLCSSSNYLALFSDQNLYFISLKGNFDTKIFPVKGVSFCCFSDDILYIRISNSILKLKNNLFFKCCNISSIPLTICDDFLVVLSEPISILPRPSVDYLEIKNRKVEEIELKNEKIGSYVPRGI